ncbi:MAG: hypothetical protein ACAI44_38575 [Candidatus Sericytochromatia bacterium]
MKHAIIGNRHGMNHFVAFHAARQQDANRNHVMDELRPASARLARKLDANNDRCIDAAEMTHALAQGDVYINPRTHKIGAYNKGFLGKLFS